MQKDIPMANNKMLIDASHPEETRVAMVRGNRVDEFDFESEHKTQLRGNIYLAKITRVEPSLQAAFVDYGGNRHGFLAFSEIHPDYYQIPVADRQALLEAEAEDARAAAAEEDDDEVNGDDSPVEEAEEKPPRKRRSRRRSKKVSEAQEKDKSEEPSTELKEEPSSEEDDSDDSVMAADNENDDVVSEAAKEPPRKTRRQTSRKKKEPEAKSEEPATPDIPVTPEDAKVSAKPAAKKPRRKTSRKKKVVEETTEVESTETASDVSEQEPVKEEEKKPRKRTSRKRAKAKESDTESTSDDENQLEAEDLKADGNDEAENKVRKPRSRTRSRRGKKSDQDGNGSRDDETENGTVEELGSRDAMEEVPTRRARRRRYKIQEVIKRRQIILVQVVKEERGNKGAALTTYLSLAGRYSVLMPNTARGGGISRKITNPGDRKRLKSVASALEVPQGMGVILRTAGASLAPEEIQRDFEYLMRLWENVRTLTLESTAPCLVYEEGSLIKRSIRDLYDRDTGEILVSGEAGHREAKDFMTMLMPDHASQVKLYKDRVPMFARMGVEAQLDAMLQPQVTLKSGGYLILDQTEALVAIDVNSGRSTRQHSIEETATKTNLEAADEVARQLRLRDLAGLIVIDFIDMEEKRNIRAVEKRLKDALKNDRARIQVGRISHFGLMEMSRQRIRASVLESTTQTCPICEGLGHVRSSSSVALGVLRAIEEHLNRNSRNNLNVRVSTTTALYLLNSKRESLSDLEERFGISILILTDDSLGTTPCAIEKGELSNRRPAPSTAVQADMVMDTDETSEQQTDSEPDNQAQTNEEDDNGEPKKRRRRRRRRGTRKDDEKPELEADSESAPAEDSNSSSADVETKADKGVAKETVSLPDDEESKPRKRTRRTRKAKTEEDVTSEENVVTDSNKEEKSKKPRRKKAQKADESEATETAKFAEPDAEEKPKRRTTRRKKVNDADAEPMAQESPTEDTATTEEAAEDGTKRSKRGGWWQRKFF